MPVPPFVWLAGVAGALWLGVRKLRRYLPSQSAPEPDTGTDTVRCARCGVFVPKNHAVEHQGRWYCGKGHAGLPSNS